MGKIRALIIDDTVVYRKILTDILSTFDDVEVVGSAPNGKLGLAKIIEKRPDLVTLDIEMPVMDGMETLSEIKRQKLDVAVIMVSAFTTAGAKTTMKALQLGAFDFVGKPAGKDAETSKSEILSQMKPIIRGFIRRQVVKSYLKGPQQEAPPIEKPAAAPPPPPPPRSDVAQRMDRISRQVKPDIIAIGVSTGGPVALTKVIPVLPVNYKVPVVIVQHMPPVFTGALADSLNKQSNLVVVEGSHGQVLEPGKVYIAPGGKQMRLELKDQKTRIVLTDDPPENHCKPAVDYLFRSVSQLYGNRAIGVIMTGMGTDGTTGLRLMKRRGAKVIAQDEQSCVVFGMPMEAINSGVVDKILPLDDIAGELISLVK